MAIIGQSGMARPTSLDHYLQIPIHRILPVMYARPKTYFNIFTSHPLSLSCSPRSYSSSHTTAYPDSPDSDARSDGSFSNRYSRCCRYHIVTNVGTARVVIIGHLGMARPTSLDHYLRIPIHRILPVMYARPELTSTSLRLIRYHCHVLRNPIAADTPLPTRTLPTATPAPPAPSPTGTQGVVVTTLSKMLGRPQWPSLVRSGMARPTSLDHYLRIPSSRILLVM